MARQLDLMGSGLVAHRLVIAMLSVIPRSRRSASFQFVVIPSISSLAFPLEPE